MKKLLFALFFVCSTATAQEAGKPTGFLSPEQCILGGEYLENQKQMGKVPSDIMKEVEVFREDQPDSAQMVERALNHWVENIGELYIKECFEKGGAVKNMFNKTPKMKFDYAI